VIHFHMHLLAALTREIIKCVSQGFQVVRR
jgi:hypothetical protein